MQVSRVAIIPGKIKLFTWKSLTKALGILSILLFFGCIEEFNPEIEETAQLLVIDGCILKNDSIQKIVISRSSAFNDSEYDPEQGCVVWVENKNGDMFYFSEGRPGEYLAAIPESYLTYNSEFRLGVITPETMYFKSEEYQSDFEPIFESSEIDSVYYLEEPYQSSSETYENGMQFYTDLKASEGATKYYRWLMAESWEYHSSHYIYGHWDPYVDSMVVYDRFIDSLYICYDHDRVKQFFSATTDNLILNEKKKIPLNFIPENSGKIKVKYSMLVKQFAISKNAYLYWEKNRVETEESGGLYNTQPGHTITNIRCISNPDEKALGYFWASSYSSVRIYFRGPFGKGNTTDLCELEAFNYAEPQYSWPMTYVDLISGSTANPVWGTADTECFDCRLRGGTTTKPDYWDNF